MDADHIANLLAAVLGLATALVNRPQFPKRYSRGITPAMKKLASPSPQAQLVAAAELLGEHTRAVHELTRIEAEIRNRPALVDDAQLRDPRLALLRAGIPALKARAEQAYIAAYGAFVREAAAKLAAMHDAIAAAETVLADPLDHTGARVAAAEAVISKAIAIKARMADYAARAHAVKVNAA